MPVRRRASLFDLNLEAAARDELGGEVDIGGVALRPGDARIDLVVLALVF